MKTNIYRCAAVFSANNILLYKNGKYTKGYISNKINGQILVGDFLKCEIVYEQIYAIEIINRKNSIKRLQAGKMQGLVSNIDVVFIVTSANQDFNLARLERYYIIARESGARVCFLLSKSDLIANCDEYIHILEERFSQSAIEKTSIYCFENQALFSHWYPNETAVFLGSSGVGKSSLINMLLKNNIIMTQSIRENDGKGRHTTTARHIYALEDQRMVVDTPGLRSVGISAHANTIDELFPEMKALECNCKYRNCSHISEPGCAIRIALEREELDYERYMRYLKLIGDEEKRKIITQGKAYKKIQLIKEMKKINYRN